MNHFDLKAVAKEKAFVRKLRYRAFLTGIGKRNEIVEVTPRYIRFTTAKSNMPQQLSRVKLRRAISSLLFRRTLTRNELASEFKCAFNSAMLGLLRAIFSGNARIHRCRKGGVLRITLRSVRHFFSGAVRAPRDMLLAIKNGARFFLISYAHVRFRKNWHCLFEQMAKQYGVQLLVDSGAFTVSQAIKNGRTTQPVDVEQYANFLSQFQDLIFGFFNLDVIGDPEASRKNGEYLRQRGFEPIEVFHYGSDWDVLGRMVSADQTLIGIGGTVGLSEGKKRTFLKEVFCRFPGQLFHLLGCGSPLILEFPIFSADSSTWLLGRKFLVIMTPKQVKAPAGWCAEDCIAHNVRLQSYYEDWESGALQTEMALIC